MGKASNYTGGMFPALGAIPSVPFAPDPTPIEELNHLRAVLGLEARLLVKRDDAIAFAFGGNKVRKMRFVAAAARAAGADTLITTGGVQSNHARVTAAAAAALGMRCILVVNGAEPDPPTANALLDRLLGADIVYVASREERAPAMARAAEQVRHAGATPFVIPLGASTPLFNTLGTWQRLDLRSALAQHMPQTGGDAAIVPREHSGSRIRCA